MHKLFYCDEYCKASYSFDTTRKAKWIADSLARSPVEGVEIHRPEFLTPEDFKSVHSEEYVDAIISGDPVSLTSSSGLDWCPDMFEALAASNGGVVSGVEAAIEDGISGSLSSGMHHARYGHGLGFCTFNGLVLGAKKALSMGKQNVLIIDLDAHCGGGTNSLISSNVRIRQLDIGVDAFDTYDGSVVVNDSSYYLPLVRKSLKRIPANVDFVIYNAGMDIHQSDCGIPGITRKEIILRDAAVFEWCCTNNVPICYVLAGGYTSQEIDSAELTAHHRITIRCASHFSGRRSEFYAKSHEEGLPQEA